MKKIFCLLSAIVILVSFVGSVWGDSPNAVAVTIHELEQAIGGNKTLERYIRNSNSEPLKDARDSYNFREASMKHENISFEEEYAHYKFRYMSSKDVSVVVVDYRVRKLAVKKRIKSNTVPTKKTGLLNADDPVDIITFGNILRFSSYYGPSRDFYYNVTDHVRLLDEKGNVLKTLAPRAGVEVAEIELSPEYKNYYFELDYEGNYIYILIRAKATEIPAKQSAKMTKLEEHYQKEGDKFKGFVNDYMKENSISDIDDLTEKDENAIGQMFLQQRMTEAGFNSPLSAQEQNDQQIANQIVAEYMKKHSIKSPKDLTDEDKKAIEKEIMKRFTGNQKQTATPKKSTSKKKRK